MKINSGHSSFSTASIGRNLFRNVLYSYLAITALVTVFQIGADYRGTESRLINDLVQFDADITTKVSPLLKDSRVADLQTMLFELSKPSSITAIEILDADRNRITSIGNALDPSGQSQPILESSIANRQISRNVNVQGSERTTFYSMDVPLVESQTAVGYAVVSANRPSFIEQVKNSIAGILLASGLKALGLLIVLLFFIRKIIQKPLSDLTHAARKLTTLEVDTVNTANDLEKLSQQHGDSEIAALSTDFIRMRNVLSEKIDYIEAQNRTLEDRVKERTDTIQKVNKKLEMQSLHDPLTGLANRTLLHDRLTHQLQISERSSAPFAFASIDLKKFKLINDTYGHLAGDEVLKQVSSRVKNCLRSADTVARMGGDEFAIIFHHTSVDKLDVIVQRIMDAIADPCQFEDQSINAGINIGIAIYPEHGRSAKDLYQNADMAMYIAKSNGMNLQYFSNEVRRDLQRHHALRTSISDAVELNQLHLVYQPIVRCDDGRASAVEALLRWEHPDLGPISPAEFIPIAESTGAISAITDWVFQQSMREIGDYDDSVSLSINLSEKLLIEEDLASRLTEYTLQQGYSPERITLELTESVMVENPTQAISTLSDLKKCGFQISIDDFGTGYSSLSYLARLPIDEVKIDQQFLADIINSDPELRINSTVIVLSIVALAHRMNLRIVAEGVETDKISDLATQYGVDYLQGYFYAEPMPVDATLMWLNENLQSRQVA